MTEPNTSTVAQFPKHSKRRAGSPMSQAQRHLNQCCTLALKYLPRGLPEILDQVDDSLFQLAEKADHDNTQKLYFDAMREVRIQRPGIEKYFKEYLVEAFETCGEEEVPSQQPRQKSRDSFNVFESNLTLIDDAELEESLAVTNMANRIVGICKEELFALDMRVGWLLDDTALDNHNNPLAPRAICEAFAQACSEIEAETEIRLIVLKHFDKHMGTVMLKAYKEINRYLVSNDVLPYIRAEVKKQPHSAPQVSTSNLVTNQQGLEPSAASGQGQNQVFTGFPAQGQTHCGPAQVSATGSIPTSDGQTNPAMPLQLSQELLATLQQVMRVNSSSGSGQSGDLEMPTPGPELLGRLTAMQVDSAITPQASGTLSNELGGGSTLRDLRHTELGSELNHGDDLMIDVVAMMFDYVFDDSNIPAPMKALIGRLQIPLLKVALVDKSFFSRRFHPARKLLNTLADAAVGWTQDQENIDGLYSRMEVCVQRVLDEFEDEVGVIAEILAEFEASIEEESRQAEENAWWSAKVIQGRERLSIARAEVDELIDERLSSVHYTFLKTFVREHWQNLLLTIFVKDGDESDSWQESMAVLDDLVWSVTPIEQETARARLSIMLPDLLARMKQGMERISLPAEEISRFLAKLGRIHLAQVRGGELPSEDEIQAIHSEGLPQVKRKITENADDQDSVPVDRDIGEREVQTQSLDEQRLCAALEKANQDIYQQAQERPECSGMGTTMVAAWFRGEQMITAHAGDSRLYRLRDGVFEQITLDHSLRQQMVSNGFYTAEEAKQSIASNLVTRALGVDQEVEIEVHSYSVMSGDVYLLCSDGLSDLVEDCDIEAILCEPDIELELAADALITAANENGGSDNISISLVQVWQAVDAQNDSSNVLELIAKSDVGRRRSHNEDAQGDVVEAGLVLLADGMGGYNAGEVASQLAIQSVIEFINEDSLQDFGMDVVYEDSIKPDPDINFTALNDLFDNAGIDINSDASPFPEIELDDEIVLESDFSTDETDAQSDDGYEQQVADLEIGVWVEFRRENETPNRARLTWISESTGNYLFTDRHGHKVVDSTPAGLVLEFRRGSAVEIEDVPLFERAVNHLMTRLTPTAA